ncbi:MULTISPECIES: hypothetical protein [Colwellia]|uniref:Uncharacterized protein n=1 Tax=Colwellia marinimaniae TaxID=1513592 RepID=A0ABQ0MUB9_9GAMM|nr:MULTISPECIES: hypothetical protein [Colwellia]GAW95967.1 hypothetical protein MTCD1_01573 [Colwellia marinimaniae]
MKETTSILLLFIFVGVYSGAMGITATVIFMIIGGGPLIYLAWLVEMKEKLKNKELIIMRKERLARRNLN